MLPLPPGIARVNERVAPGREVFDDLQLILRPRIGKQLEVVRDNRQIAESPLLYFSSYKSGSANPIRWPIAQVMM